MKTYLYNGEQVFLKAESYRNNGNLALVMVSLDGTIRDVITVNLNSGLQSDSLCFIDSNNHPLAESFICENGLGVNMGVMEQSGFCQYPLFHIFLDSL